MARRPGRYAWTWRRPGDPVALPSAFLSAVGIDDDALLSLFAAKTGETLESLRGYGEAYARSGSATGLREGYAGVAAGATPFGVPAERGVNLSNVDAELLARIGAMYEAAPPAAKRDFAITSGFRTYEQQVDIWRRSRGGTLFAAAPPGASRHERGPAQAIDIRDPTGWFHANGKRFGLAWPVRGDYPHTQLDPAWRGPSFARVAQAGAGAVGSELIGGATVPEGTHDATIAALNEVARRQGVDPAAIAMMIHTESGWDPMASTGRYRGLTQIGPEQAAWSRLGRMSPADQIRAYGQWLDYYDFRGKRAESGVDFKRMNAAEQAAYLQGFQFAPNAMGWQRAYGRGIRTVPTTETTQASALGDTTLQAMTGYYRHLMQASPPRYREPQSTAAPPPTWNPPPLMVPAPVVIKPVTEADIMPWLSEEESREIAGRIVSMESQLAELRRRLGAIVRHGRVTDVDAGKQLARIELSTDDESKKSAWVPYGSDAGDFKSVVHPSVGQNMTLFAPTGDPAQGVLLPYAFSGQYQSPSDDAGTHVLADYGGARLEVKSGEFNFSAARINFTVTEKLTVDGKTYLGKKDATEHVLKEGGSCEKVWGF